MMRLVICEGNRILSEALAVALEARDPELDAVAVATADECISAICGYRPDVCMLDVRLPETGDGLQVIHEICRRFPDTLIVAVCDGSEPSTSAKARKLGVTGFLATNRSVSEMADALQRIAAGQPVFDSVPPTSSRPRAKFVLTPREAEVLRRIADGQHTRQMACEMDIAISTLRSYVKNVFAKIGVHSRVEAAAVARRANLLAKLSPPARPAEHFPIGLARRRRARIMLTPPFRVVSPRPAGGSLVAR